LSPRAFTPRPRINRRGLAKGRADPQKARMIITLCASCDLGRSGFAAPLRAALAEVGVAVDLRLTDCMSGCTRPSTCAFRAPGKTAYLFGDLTADDLPDLVTFARHYAASPDGNLPDARVLGGLRMKAIARIPG
jgi:predicted metal-binding protein